MTEQEARDDERQALVTQLRRKYAFHKRFSPDTEHETMVLLRAAADFLDRGNLAPEVTEEVRQAAGNLWGGFIECTCGYRPLNQAQMNSHAVALEGVSDPADTVPSDG